MHNKRIRKLLKKNKLNSGFTLTELLTGLFMSIFVTGALGFGLLQILQATTREKARSDTRNEASRAVEFISDELRRAQGIEVDTSAGNLNTVANSHTPPTGANARLVLQVPGVDERIIYSVAPPQAGSPWQGPLVVYRWGPDLNSNGVYTNANNPAAWDNDALIDGIDNTNQTIDCGGNSVTYQGFFACIVDDDGDGVVEDGTVDTNGDGVVNAQDSDDDADGFGETAQIFLTGGIDTDAVAGNDENYTAETRAVARAKNATVNSAVAGAVRPITMKSLVADYVSGGDPTLDADGFPVYVNGARQFDGNGNPRIPQEPETWTMRMDFDNNPYDSSQTNNATQWIHETGRQAQPINIDSTNDLEIYSIPVVNSQQTEVPLSRGNPSNLNEDTNLSDFVTDPNAVTVSHIIKFKADAVLDSNNNELRASDAYFYKTYNGGTTSGYNNPNVKADGTVQVLKNGTTLVSGASIDTSSTTAPAPLYSGYDFDGDGNPDRMSLGRFLFNEGYATLTVPSEISQIAANDSYDYRDPPSGYTINNLEDDERIIAFEIGQDDNGDTVDTESDSQAHPGFDLQDNVLIMRHDVFDDDQ